MILSEQEAITKQCIYQQQQGQFRPRPMQAPVMCIGSACMMGWRWFDTAKTLGYCNILGQGKPEV